MSHFKCHCCHCCSCCHCCHPCHSCHSCQSRHSCHHCHYEFLLLAKPAVARLGLLPASGRPGSVYLQLSLSHMYDNCLGLYTGTLWTICGLFMDYNIDYILVQQSTTVSLTGLPVLRTVYKPMSMHKSSNSQNCEFCVVEKL